MSLYIPEFNIDLEIDSKQHEYEDRKEKDEIRDVHISKKYKIYRIKWKCINTDAGKNYMREQIENFLKFCQSLN
jgi:hypothetical protein